MSQASSTNNLEKLSHKKLAKLLLESDDMNIIKEMARRINLGLIPLAMVGFSKLSYKKLKYLEAFSECSWPTREIWKRVDEGKIPSRVVTIEQVKEELRRAREATA